MDEKEVKTSFNLVFKLLKHPNIFNLLFYLLNKILKKYKIKNKKILKILND